MTAITSKGILQQLVDKVFANPRISNFVRIILENNFRETRNVIRKELDCSKNTLDLGCGTGMFSPLFSSYTGIDISEKYIGHARRKYSKDFRVSDGTAIGLSEASFDNVLICGVLHHLDDETTLAVLDETARLLKPGGQALIIEDIPVRHSTNLLGRIVHHFDSGGFIRPMEDYLELLKRHLVLDNSYFMRSGICDYAVFVCAKK